jgi:hypothetical protein
MGALPANGGLMAFDVDLLLVDWHSPRIFRRSMRKLPHDESLCRRDEQVCRQRLPRSNWMRLA